MGEVWSNMAAHQKGGLEFLSKTFIHDQRSEYKILFKGEAHLWQEWWNTIDGLQHYWLAKHRDLSAIDWIAYK